LTSRYNLTKIPLTILVFLTLKVSKIVNIMSRFADIRNSELDQLTQVDDSVDPTFSTAEREPWGWKKFETNFEPHYPATPPHPTIPQKACSKYQNSAGGMTG
jgi:hypothetical protein